MVQLASFFPYATVGVTVTKEDVMTRNLSGISPADIETHLQGVSYPATKQELISIASERDAPVEMLDLLEWFPEQEYGSPNDVLKAYLDIVMADDGGKIGWLRALWFGLE